VDKVTGRANYGADLTLPGMLHGAVLRSPHAHARIVSIDTSAAEAVAGVKAIVTGKDFPETTAKLALGEAAIDLHDIADNVIARTKVLYDGHAVAAVAATNPGAAREALSKINVVYDVLAAVMTIDQATAPNAPILHDAMVTKGVKDAKGPSNVAARMELKRGDVEKGFAEADVVVEREYRTPTVHQGYIEPHACVVRFGEDGRAVVWCSTQGPFAVRDQVGGDCGNRSGARQSDPERDRRRLRRQDRGLSRAARSRIVAQGTTTGENGDEPRRGVQGVRSNLRHENSRKNRSEAGRDRHRRQRVALL
jgi:CO/xanthine dehydrogenase Mo-binding subunit